MEQRATVTVIRGHGEERMRQAIAQGLVREDLKGDFEEVLRQLDEVRAELKMARLAVAEERKSYERFAKLYQDSLRAMRREEKRRKRKNDCAIAITVFVTIFVIVLLSMMLCRAIFG